MKWVKNDWWQYKTHELFELYIAFRKTTVQIVKVNAIENFWNNRSAFLQEFKGSSSMDDNKGRNFISYLENQYFHLLTYFFNEKFQDFKTSSFAGSSALNFLYRCLCLVPSCILIRSWKYSLNLCCISCKCNMLYYLCIGIALGQAQQIDIVLWVAAEVPLPAFLTILLQHLIPEHIPSAMYVLQV